MKRWLNQASLAKMHLSFARQEPVAEQPLRTLETASLLEAALVGDEDVPDVRRMIDDVEMFARQKQVNQITVLANETRKEGERIAAGKIDDR